MRKNIKKHRKSVIKRKLKFQDYKNYLQANQLEKKIIQLGKNKLDINSLGKNQKEFI